MEFAINSFLGYIHKFVNLKKLHLTLKYFTLNVGGYEAIRIP